MRLELVGLETPTKQSVKLLPHGRVAERRREKRVNKSLRCLHLNGRVIRETIREDALRHTKTS